MRKILGVLLGVLFLVSLSASAVSAACNSCNWWEGCKDKCDCDCKEKVKCDWWGCKDKCDCDCKDKCKCDCKDKCECKDKCDCKKKSPWFGDFGNWGLFGNKFWI